MRPTKQMLQNMTPEERAKATAPKNHLSDVFYQLPHTARATMTRAQVKDTLLYTEGRITACGQRWDVIAKPLAAGVYVVTLQVVS